MRKQLLSLSDAHDQRLPAVQSRIVIHVASIDKRHGFAHVLRSPAVSHHLDCAPERER